MPDTVAQRWYFQPDGSLGDAPPGADGGASTYVHDPDAAIRTTLPSGDINATSPPWDYQPINEGTAAVFLSAPLTEDLFARQCEACLAHDTADRLHEIAQPTLIVCGRHDRLTPPRLHRLLADEIPDAHLVTIDYGAHLVMAESAERFNRVVLQFLSTPD